MMLWRTRGSFFTRQRIREIETKTISSASGHGNPAPKPARLVPFDRAELFAPVWIEIWIVVGPLDKSAEIGAIEQVAFGGRSLQLNTANPEEPVSGMICRV
jgi:hypothetical protein